MNTKLENKAEYFEGLDKHAIHERPGLVEKCLLRFRDVSSYEPLDDDNDGGYTNIILLLSLAVMPLLRMKMSSTRKKNISSNFIFRTGNRVARVHFANSSTAYLDSGL